MLVTAGIATLHLERPILFIIDCRNRAAERDAGPAGSCVPSGTCIRTISCSLKTSWIESLDWSLTALPVVLKISSLTISIRDIQTPPRIVAYVNYFRSCIA